MRTNQFMRKRLIAKKGNFAVVTAIIGGLFGLVFLIAIYLFVFAKLNLPSLFTASSLEANATTDLTRNLTVGASTLGSYIPTIVIFGVIVLLVAIAGIAFLYVRRFSEQSGGGGGLG